MRKKLLIFVVSCMFFNNAMVVSQAAEWKQDNTGYWYQNDDGTYPINEWKWIDKNNDGLTESYYFDNNGYLLINTTIDGYQVNSEGAWVVNDIVQTQNVNKTFALPKFTEANPKYINREILLDSDTYLYDLSGYTKDDMNYAMASYSVYLEKLGYFVDISNSKVDHTGVYVPIAKDGVAVGATMQVKDNGNWFVMVLSVINR